MLNIIVNPTAGGKSGRKIRSAIPKIQKELVKRKVEYAFHYTERHGQATAITSELIKNGATDIIAIGGDGTLHEVLNGFTDFDHTNLGIIPCGTGNDFASALGLSFDPVLAINFIIDGTPKYTDFMQMPTVRGLNIIGTGVDADVLMRYERLKRKTKFGYVKCLLKALMHVKFTKFSAELNGETKNYDAFMACVANGHRYGGGIKICPPANPTDNKLDFVAVDKLRGFGIIKALLKLKKGKILTLKESTHQNMQEIKIVPEGKYVVNVDGELYENIPFEVKIVSNKLKIYR